jgi:hypothetical protein
MARRGGPQTGPPPVEQAPPHPVPPCVVDRFVTAGRGRAIAPDARTGAGESQRHRVSACSRDGPGRCRLLQRSQSDGSGSGRAGVVDCHEQGLETAQGATGAAAATRPRAEGADGPRPHGAHAADDARTTPDRRLYKKRGQTVEPVFGQIKSARGCDGFMRRGTVACDSEWKLLCATHNLLKLWRRGKAGWISRRTGRTRPQCGWSRGKRAER